MFDKHVLQMHQQDNNMNMMYNEPVYNIVNNSLRLCMMKINKEKRYLDMKRMLSNCNRTDRLKDSVICEKLLNGEPSIQGL